MISVADLSERNLEVLQILRELKIASRLEISRKSKLHVDKVSGALNRLEVFGLVEKPNGWRNKDWRMTSDGWRFFGETPPELPESQEEPMEYFLGGDEPSTAEQQTIGPSIRLEQDPFGKSAHDAGAKLDSGKPRLGLVLLGFSRALEEVGRVGTYGARKYTDNGWIAVPNGEQRYTDALLRHLFKEGAGEDIDMDTGLLHAAHVAWNALARLDLALRRRSLNQHAELD